jgi:hypothetical protein
LLFQIIKQKERGILKMKKFLLILLSISILVSLVSMQVLAGPNGTSYGNVKKVAEGDIKIDAVKDEAAWANALAIPIKITSADTPGRSRAGATGTGYVLWCDKGLYVFGEVNDTTPTHTPFELRNNPWGANYLVDSLEIFVDLGNTGAIENVGHAKVDIDGLGYITFTTDWMGRIGDDAKPWMQWAGRLDGETYYVEAFIYFEGSYRAGDEIGFQLQINDMTDPSMENDDDRVVMLSNYSTSWDVENHNYIVLSGESAAAVSPPPADEPADVPVDAPADAPAETPANQPSAPTTGDAFIITIIVALAAAMAVAFSKRRKTQ